MGNIFGGKNSFINRAGRDINRTVINAGHYVETGVAKTSDAVLKQALATLKDLQNAGRQANKDWNNAGKGEVGKYVSGVGQSVYNLTLAAPKAVVTGQYGKEFQKALGSAANIYSAGTLDYVGRSPSLLKELGKVPLIGENVAALAHGTSTEMRAGVLGGRDANLIMQGAVKAGAVVGAYYGGSYLISQLGSSGAAASSTAAASSEGGAVLVETAAPITELGTVTSADIAVSGVSVAGQAAAPAAAAAATTATPWATYALAGTTGIAVLTGQKPAGQGLTEILTGGGYAPPETGGILDGIGDLFRQPASNGTPISYAPNNILGEQVAALLPQTEQGKILLWTGIALAAALFIRSKFGKK